MQSTTQPLQQAVILPSEEALEADNLPVVELGRDYTRAAIAERRRPMDNLPSMGMIARDRQDVETDLVKVRNRVKRLKQVKKRTEHHAELNRKKAEQRAEFLLKKHEAKTWLQQQRYVNVVDKRQKTQLKRQLRDNRAASILEYRKEVLLYKQQQTLEYREQVKLASEKLRQEKEAVVLYNRQKKNVVRAGQHMATVRRERKRQVFLETVEQQRKLRIQQAMAGKNSLLDEIALLRAEEIALLKEQQQQQ
jgi:hypothetical protein